MESTVLSVGKSVLDGALGYAKSAIAEEVALQLGVQRDHAFIRGELEMMLAFLMAAHDERDEHMVVKTWVKQVRDVAYDVEDCLQGFPVRLGMGNSPWWWCCGIPRTLLDRRRVAKQMKELRAKVEDVSQRNVRYHLIKGSAGSKQLAAASGISNAQSSLASASLPGIMEEARWQQDRAKADLVRLISSNKDDDHIRVIAVWGRTSRALVSATSIVRRAYNDLKTNKKFERQAWVTLTHPFNLTEFLQNIVRQFYADCCLGELAQAQDDAPAAAPGGTQDLRRMGRMKDGYLVRAFNKYVAMKSYLIVLTDLSTVEEWDQIKACFPDNKRGSRLVACTEKIDVASLCVGPETMVLEHKQLSTDQTLYAFYEKGSQDETRSMESRPSFNTDTTNMNRSVYGKRLARMETSIAASKESHNFIGREKEKSDIIKLISNKCSQQEFKVISICGMGGLGKTTLVKYVYQSQEVSAMFDKRACVTIKHPFDPNELINSLATQLDCKETISGDRKKPGNQLSLLANYLEGNKYLIVLDDLSSITEWDTITHLFPTSVTKSRIIVTTRQENVAKHCSKEDKNIYKLEFLGDRAAHSLFTEKVFQKVIDLDEQHPELAEEEKIILKKCKGLPLAIVTIGGFLAKQPKIPMEWRKLNEHISAELDMNPELGMIKNVLMKSYDGLPYHLKSCFLYMSIFPDGHNISRRRLVHRWTAEGYSSDVRGKSPGEIADCYFMELIDRSMILPSQRSIIIDSCKVHDLMRDISISKSMEENLVFRLEESCSSNAHGTVRHLTISSNWKGDKSEFESAVDLSRIRSLTVFGEWRSFFISDKMRLLRVLDLEGTSGLVDHHLEHIGKLLHLKYLSLRGCDGIFHLPDSLGNMRQLQTLDIKGTCIIVLPKTIIKLRKLQYLRAEARSVLYNNTSDFLCDDLPKLCVACCAPACMRDVTEMEGNPNTSDVCTFYCCVMFPFLARQGKPPGLVVPSGIWKLKALHTLSLVNIARGKAVLKGIRKLTQLRKLGVTGISKKNCHEFCSTLTDLIYLESLSVHLEGEQSLYDCLDGLSSPLKNLQSLKLEGNLAKLPGWTERLHNLVKLKLEKTEILESDAAIQVLGKLPNLAILRLMRWSFKGDRHRFTFHPWAFPNLMVLELFYVDGISSFEFEERATPKLELLLVRKAHEASLLFYGLSSLPSLKEVLVDDYGEDFVEDMRAQLAMNPNKPILKNRLV